MVLDADVDSSAVVRLGNQSIGKRAAFRFGFVGVFEFGIVVVHKHHQSSPAGGFRVVAGLGLFQHLLITGRVAGSSSFTNE